MESLPVHAAHVLPHRETMLLIDELTECGNGSARCKAKIGPDHPFVDCQGELESVALVEILSQGAAALRGYQGIAKSKSPRVGYLAGIKDLKISEQARSGQTLSIEVSETIVLGAVAVMDGRVLRDDVCLCSGTLKVWEEDQAGPPRTPEAAEPSATRPATTRPATSEAAGGSTISRAIFNSLAQIELEKPENRATGVFQFNRSFPGFHGHFPDYPILPGVVMLKMALTTCERLLEHRLDLIEVEQAKFTGQAYPEQAIRVEVRLISEDDRWRIKAKLARGEDRIAVFTLTGIPAEAR